MPLALTIWGAEAGAGKKSIILDTKTPKGKEILNRLIKKADFIVINKGGAAGALAINSTMGATLDASSAVFGFERCGIALNGGHEAMVSETWVAAYFWSDALKAHNQAIS
jgi:hypothetical protein